MKLRHHRKHVQRLMVGRSAHRSRTRIYFASSARRSGKTAAALQWLIDGIEQDERLQRAHQEHLLDAIRYGFSAIKWIDHVGEFSPPPLTEIELAAQRIVQDAEIFDRTLEHYFRPGDLEAIPIGRDLDASNRYYQQRLREAGERLGLRGFEERTELTRAARRYSHSAAYAQWLREHPPEVRR